MPSYIITATIPSYWTYRVEAADEAAALAVVNNDEVDPDQKFIDYDASVLEIEEEQG